MKIEDVYEEVVRWVAARMRVDQDTAREAVHAVVARLRADNIRNLRNYLTTASVREHRRSCKRKRWLRYLSELTREELACYMATPSPGPCPDEIGEENEAAAIAKAEIARMPPREREIMRLFFDGLKSKEIAAALGISAATVRSTYRHVVEKLREEFGVARTPPRKTRTCRRSPWPKNAKSCGPSATQRAGFEPPPTRSAAG